MKHNEIEKDKHYRQHLPEIESDEEEDVTVSVSDDELQNAGHESNCDSEGSVSLDEDDSMYGENIEVEDEDEDEDEEGDEMNEEEFDYVDEEEDEEELVGLKNQEDDALLERKATTFPEFNFNYKVDCR